MKTENGDDQGSEISPTTLERWAEMAGKLKLKLQSTNLQNETLQSKLDRQSKELQELRDENNYQKERIEDLEFQCLEKSSRITSLSLILETRNMNQLQEDFLQKSTEHAEMSLCVDRLRIALQKCENANQRLLEEKETLQMVHQQLSKKVEESTMAWDEAKREQRRNRKLLLDMGDVVRTLNCVTVDFESKIPPHQHAKYPMENIKRKIHAMEGDRRRLIQECNSLREENSSKDGRIQELEKESQSCSRSWSTTSRTTRSDEVEHEPFRSENGSQPTTSKFESETSPVSFDTSMFPQDNFSSTSGRANRSLRSGASKVSTFSELEAPPSEYDATNDHEQLKRYYEESLERIIRMSSELGKYKTTLQEQQEAMEQMKKRLEQTTMERDEARQEVEDALSLAEVAAGKQEEMAEVHRNQIHALQDKYDRLDADYGRQLEELEQQVVETEKFFQSHCEGLKQKHADVVASLQKEKETLQRHHYEELNAQKEKAGDLNEELDVLMEIHTKTEQELENLQKKYDEALNTIVDLDEKIQKAAEAGIADRAQLEKDVVDQAKHIADLKAKVDESKEEKQEAVLKLQKLRRENEVVLARHGQLVTELDKVKQQQSEHAATMKELRNNCCEMEERVRIAESDSSTRFQQLQASYQMAITKITSMAQQLYQAGISIEEQRKDDVDGEAQESAVSNLPIHEKIKRLEQELTGKNLVQYRSPRVEEADAQTFFHDYGLILKNLVRCCPDHLPQPIWYDRLTHQFKMCAVHRALLTKFNHHDEAAITLSFDFLLPFFIQHEMKLRKVLEMVVSEVHSPTTVEPGTSNQSKSDVNEPTTILAESSFFEHQRLLTIVHYDIIAKTHKLDSSRSSTISATSGKSESPQDVGEAKLALMQLKGETQTIKLAANTAKIRYEAREKEHRVLRLQYQKLLEQYNHALKQQKFEGCLEESPDNEKVKTAVQKIQRDAEFERLKTELRKAELKVERMVAELRTTKTKAEHTQKQHEEGEKNLQDLIRYEQQRLISMENQSPATTKALVPDIFQARWDIAPPIDDASKSSQGLSSFDGSRLTSEGGLNSGEGCDERCEEQPSTSQKVLLDGGIGGFFQLQSDHDQAKRTIILLRMQLLDAEHEAAHAKVQLKRREENLRDVIREYNLIKEKFDELEARYEEQITMATDLTNDNNTAATSGGTDLIRERNVALGKISVLEADVLEARRIAKEAHKKRVVRETQLRDVIEQFKELSQDHKKTLSTVEELRGALARYEPGRGMEVRQRSHESDEQSDGKRETSPRETLQGKTTARQNNRNTAEYGGVQRSTPTNSTNSTKRMTWLRDLGQQLGARPSAKG